MCNLNEPVSVPGGTTQSKFQFEQNHKKSTYACLLTFSVSVYIWAFLSLLPFDHWLMSGDIFKN